MELVSDVTLNKIIQQERKKIKMLYWNNTKKLICIYGIASAMLYLHSHNIVHCCLQPSNIYFDDILFPKIGDYGLSTKFFDVDTMTHQTISGNKGTPIYSAPEVLNSNVYSKASDVYAFSMVVYEIITNEIPFNEINNNQIIKDIIKKNKRPFIKESIPICYRKLIERCWAQEPDERPSFDVIVDLLKKTEFIIDDVIEEDYHKYIDFIESHLKCHK